MANKFLALIALQPPGIGIAGSRPVNQRIPCFRLTEGVWLGWVFLGLSWNLPESPIRYSKGESFVI